jgi:formylglycine-generating enzyme required for sulfatase activity
MALLAELPERVGFFSYSREDDEDSKGRLSTLRQAIGSELAQHLARNRRKDFQLWQDQTAIATGDDWESEIAKAIGQAAFFIPIVTPRAVASKYCKFEFESFLARERALGREDLIFPILYGSVPELLDEAKWRNDPLLSIVGKRQHFDWRPFRHVAPDAMAYGEAIESFCEQVVAKLREPSLPSDRRRQMQAEGRSRTEEQREPDERTQRENEARRREKREAGRPAESGESATKQQLSKRWRPSSRDMAIVAVLIAAVAAGVAVWWVVSWVQDWMKAPLTAAQGRTLKAGDSFQECADCPEMIIVPAGRFQMGSPADQGTDDEHPQHEVKIAEPFAVAKFAVTFDEWDACTARGGCRYVDEKYYGRGRRPVTNVNWDDAQAYVKWLSSITGKPYRLLSEAEYEYAARSGSKTEYPWGDDKRLNSKPMANCEYCDSEPQHELPVGSYPANHFGLYDMVGNVWEWTEDCWNKSYEGAPVDGSPRTSGDCSSRVSRGGSWNDGTYLVRSAARLRNPPSDWGSYLGFRVARTLSP